MKKPEADWERDPLRFDAGPHVRDLPDPKADHPPPEEEVAREESPEASAIHRIELLGRMHHMAFSTLFQDSGLPPAQAGAMNLVIRFPGLSQRELADKLHIQRATATVMLQKMEKAGYVDRLPDREDQRISRIYPTDMARSIDAETQKNVNAYFVRCFAGVSPEHFDIMMSAMERLGKNLRDIIQENPESPVKE